ncbi:BNR-4 repeat-containing protein [Paraferrimonas sp. SM1919]|uniref:CBM96 family carbohydrate-binding protein n=1 Tax=Paraferrimonas sp. SM1919 TaxID=2662263 RepID=UPI0013CFACA9|nr:BNR-4 repeat-containing protein [Paraferrimonas sp. SM1919]
MLKRSLTAAVFLFTQSLQAATVTELFKYTDSSAGQPSFDVRGDNAYILFTHGKSHKGRICHYNLRTDDNDCSGDLFKTLAPHDVGHNQSAIAVDGDGYIHAWIGMHNHKMRYYRSVEPNNYQGFEELSHTLPGYDDEGLQEKRYTYPAAVSNSRGDVFFVARRTGLFMDDGILRESQHDEKQDLYIFDNATDSWSLKLIKAQEGRNAYMSNLYADDNNNLHIVTAWSQIHDGDNTFQRGTYLRYSNQDNKFYKADGTQVDIPVDVDTHQADLFYSGEMPWGDKISEIQTPQVTLNSDGQPVISYPYNTAVDYSKKDPKYVLNVAKFNGSDWTTQTGISDLRNHERPPITRVSQWLNIYSRDKNNAYIHTSTDKGDSFSLVTDLKDGGEPYVAKNINQSTDLYINNNRLFKVEYQQDGNHKPSVQITYPINGQQFEAQNQIMIHADANDNDGEVTAVEFFVDGKSIGIDEQAPYQMPWQDVREGRWLFSAVAFDEQGEQAHSNKVRIKVNNRKKLNLTPIEDAYVRDGEHQEDNFNTDTLAIKGDEDSGYNRETLLKFKLSKVKQAVKQAQLSFIVKKATKATLVTAGVMSSNDWDESDVTWNTAPSTLHDIETVIIDAKGKVKIDLTDAINDNIGEKYISIRLYNIDLDGALVEINSQESQHSPELQLSW